MFADRPDGYLTSELPIYILGTFIFYLSVEKNIEKYERNTLLSWKKGYKMIALWYYITSFVFRH